MKKKKNKGKRRTTTTTKKIEGEESFTVCTLSWGRQEQFHLDLQFEPERRVSFSVRGKGEIHLIGSYEALQNDSDDEDDEDPSSHGLPFYDEDVDSDMEEGEDEEPKIVEIHDAPPAQKEGTKKSKKRPAQIELVDQASPPPPSKKQKTDEKKPPSGSIKKGEEKPKEETQKKKKKTTSTSEPEKKSSSPASSSSDQANKCSHCDRAFSSSGALAAHKMAKHSETAK